MSESAWTNLPQKLGGEDIVGRLNKALKTDPQFLAFVRSDALTESVTFGIVTSSTTDALLVEVSNGRGCASLGRSSENVSFTITALPDQWSNFFQQTPPPGFQNYWSMLRYNLSRDDVAVLGSQLDFARFAHIWRRALEILHDLYCGPTPLDTEAETDEDFVQGKYIFIRTSVWGRTKIHVEYSGEGEQEILFLHTAGADSRQYHGVMNDERMRAKCKMYAFDLPSHGRSYPAQVPFGAYSNTEDSYVGCIAAVIKKLALKRPVVCGASMAGQVCLAVAIRNNEVESGGVIPLESCDHLTRDRSWSDQSPYVNQATFVPEAIYGLIAPTAPAANKALIWHQYSSGGYGLFHGDLDFYNTGWDGRDRVSKINTNECPVYMLTGEYDYSTTPEMSKATADKIKGARFEKMEQLGHFPATENPAKFVPYLLKAVEGIQVQQGRSSWTM